MNDPTILDRAGLASRQATAARQAAARAAHVDRMDAERRALGFGPLPVVARLTAEEQNHALRAAALLWDHELHARDYLSAEQQAAVRATLRAVAQVDTSEAEDTAAEDAAQRIRP